MKFVYMLMGGFDSKTDRVSFPNSDITMIGVSDIDDACKTAKELQKNGVSCIELCGAFKEDGAKKIIEATDNQVAVAHVVHFKEQDELFFKIFGN